MSKKVLVIGGSAFTGRVFCIQMSKKEDYELHVVNRGQFPLNLKGVKDINVTDTTPEWLPSSPADMIFDVMIDFPVYNPGDGARFWRRLKAGSGVYHVLNGKCL